ncbi:MAG TPA: TlyA family RNA methyltransferase [Pseudomonadales bacterium]|nr:TlyA family RNA methyltransferase [Pseudomonadales bacterium]
MAAPKKRLDELLVQLGYFADARAALGPIMSGDVLVGGQRETKAGAKVRVDADIVVGGLELRFASRGGYKLEHALARFAIDVTRMTVLDAGASTGGFTDCLLQRGAAKVYAVDVGFGQLRGRLAADDRVVVLEKTNISDLEANPIDDAIDLCTMDLSYLSLTRAIPIIHRATGVEDFVCLAKPLYEGLDEASKADMAAIGEVAERLLASLSGDGMGVQDIAVSPVFGGRGAIEFLIRVRAGKQGPAIEDLVASLQADYKHNPPSLNLLG